VQQPRCSPLPHRYGGVGNIETGHGRCHRNDVAAPYLPLYSRYILLRHEVTRNRRQSFLYGGDSIEGIPGSETGICFPVRRHEIQPPRVPVPSELHGHVFQNLLLLVIGDPFTEIVQAARIPPDDPGSVPDELKLGAVSLCRADVELDGTRGAALTFEFQDQVVGWPAFDIEAPAGTIIELLVHEAHAPGGPPLLNTHFDSWTRFICRDGQNHFETFDYESLRWLQLHIHNAKGPVNVSNVHVRRRVFPWPNQPRVTTSEAPLQRLFDASLNTLNNCAQETLVDGMARERQQYSGDGGHHEECADEFRANLDVVEEGHVRLRRLG